MGRQSARARQSRAIHPAALIAAVVLVVGMLALWIDISSNARIGMAGFVEHLVMSALAVLIFLGLVVGSVVAAAHADSGAGRLLAMIAFLAGLIAAALFALSLVQLVLDVSYLSDPETVVLTQLGDGTEEDEDTGSGYTLSGYDADGDYHSFTVSRAVSRAYEALEDASGAEALISYLPCSGLVMQVEFSG